MVGAGGFIGAHVARALKADGWIVRALSPEPLENAAISELYVGRSTDVTIAAAAVAGCERVLYLAGSTAPGHIQGRISDELSVELSALVRFGEICAEFGCRQFVFASSGGTVYGPTDQERISENHVLNPLSLYGVHKVAAEHYLKQLGRRSGMDILIFRLSNPYGPGQIVKRNQGLIAATLKAWANGQAITVWGDGNSVRDYIYIADVGEAYCKALSLPSISHVLNISSAIGYSVREVIDVVAEIAGQKISVLFEAGRAVDVRRNVLDNTNAKIVLDWMPKVKLEEGLKLTMDWIEASPSLGAR